MKLIHAALPLAAGLISTPALAELPDSTKAMIDAAVASGDPVKVSTIIELAREVHPDEGAALDAIAADFASKQQASAERAAEEQEKQIREAGIFENWSGRGELGAFRATGNTSNTGITAGLALQREGIDWRHKLTGRVDYQRTNGATSREQFLAAYEPNYKISDRLFAYALAQYERDRFQGFSGRYSVSGGIGYEVIDTDSLTLSVKAGPAYRVTEFLDGTSEDRLAALVGVDFDWAISDRIKLTHDTSAVAEAGGSATVFIDGRNTSLNFVTGLNAKISDDLGARFSYAIEYDSNPPPGAVKTDTLSRVTLIYDF